jgi:glycosyltransferase involved in cell wall biosynthesis
MKIAIITSGFLPVIDGVTVSGFYRIQKLSQWGYEVLLFVPDYSVLAEVYPNWRDYTGSILPGVKVVNLESTPFMDMDFERNVSRKSYQTLLQELEKFQPDIIHVDEPERLFVGFGRIAGIDYAKKARIPCVSFFRTNFLEYLDDYVAFPIGGITLSLPLWGMSIVKFLFKKFICWVYNSYDLTLIHNKITQQKLIEIGIKNTRYEDLNGFDLSKFDRNLRQEDFFTKNYGLSDVDRKIKLIFLGRLTPDKGWQFTLDAFLTVVQQIDPENLALIVVGDGTMQNEIANGLKGLISQVHLLGRVAPEKVPALLANSDIYITTSEKESQGMTVLEALACEIPVLAPRAGGIPQNVRDGWSGFLYTPQDVNDFVSKLKNLVENPILRKEMGAKGKEYVEKFSLDKTVQNLVNIWKEEIFKK